MENRMYNYYRRFSREGTKYITSSRYLELTRKLIIDLKAGMRYKRKMEICYPYFFNRVGNRRPKVISYGRRCGGW